MSKDHLLGKSKQALCQEIINYNKRNADYILITDMFCNMNMLRNIKKMKRHFLREATS